MERKGAQIVHIHYDTLLSKGEGQGTQAEEWRKGLAWRGRDREGKRGRRGKHMVE